MKILVASSEVLPYSKTGGLADVATALADAVSALGHSVWIVTPLYPQVLAKGGLKNEADARLILGIAQLHAGKKDDAQKTFELVKGDPKLERLAHLWEIRARTA